MIHVLFDTSALRRVNVTKSVIAKALTRLAQERKITVHVPEVVVKEYSSGQEQDCRKKLSKLRKAIADLRRIPLSKELEGQLSQASVGMVDLGKQTMAFAQHHLAEWLKASQAMVHPISDRHGARVMNDYFNGQPPYKEKKYRDDIPDSFIWQVVLDIFDKEKDMSVITSDKGIKSACESTGIQYFDNLAKFVSSDNLQTLFESALALENLLRCFAQNQDLKALLVDEAKELLSTQLVGESVTDYRILDDNMEGTVSGVDDISNLDLELSDLYYLGGGMYAIPFVAKLDGLVDSHLFKADYYCMDETRVATIHIEDCNDHYFLVEETFPLRVLGNIEVDLQSDLLESPSIKSNEMRDLLDHMRIQMIEVYAVAVDPQHEVTSPYTGV